MFLTIAPGLKVGVTTFVGGIVALVAASFWCSRELQHLEVSLCVPALREAHLTTGDDVLECG